MKKLRLLLAFCALLLGWSNASAETDVTSTYITNPSFDLGTDGTPKSTGKSFVAPYSWTPTDMPSSGTHNFSILSASETSDTSPSGFGTTVTPSNGDYYYLARHSWASSLTTILTQTSKAALPVGKYLLTIDYKIAKSSGDLTPNGYLTLQAKQGDKSLGSKNSPVSASQNNTYFNTAAWSTLLVPFEVTSEGNVDFIITFNFNPTSANIPQEAIIIDNVRLNKNFVQPVANNTTDLYFKNETTGQFLSAGHSWGTHATVDNYGQEITATVSEGIYSLKTQQYNAYLNNLYMDNGTSTPSWLFFETAASSGKYYMTQDRINYLTSNGAGAELVNVTSPTDASIWTIVSKADRKAAAMSSATIDTPSDVTFLIADANFNRNANSSVWNGASHQSDGKTENLSLAGGNNDNMCAESFHAVFSINQTLSGLSNGVYGLTAQGFYRQDGSDNEHLPYFYLGEEKATFPLKTGSENSMGDASTSFSAGLYTIDPIYVRVEGGSVELGAKLTDDNYNLWCIWDNFQLKYYGDVTVAAVKMKASVDAYNAAKDEAEAFTEESMFADAWTTLQSAITANTVNLNDPALTESALNTATANLVAANAAATAAVASKTTYNSAVTLINGGTNVDLTSLITNPSFEAGSTTGWTNSGAIGANAQGNKAFDNVQGNYYAERWHVDGTIDINQTVAALPAGIYKVEAYLFSDVADAKFYVNSENVSVSTSQKYFAVVEISDKGSIKMGASCTLTSSTWICLDDYKLTYLASSYAALPYTLATGKMGTDKATAQTDAEDAFEANPNMTTYEALLSAISDAEASVANYAKLKAAIDKANGVKDANNFVTAAATSTFESAISTATNGWTDVTFTDAQATEQITTLGTGVSGWRANATGAAGVYMTSTWGKTSENWWTDFYINTWSTEGDNDGSGFSVPFFEYYADNDKNLPAKTMTATLSGLENGVYEVALWARVQRRSDADFNSNNSMITMNVNDGDAVSIMSDTEHTVGTGTGVMRLGHYTATGIVTDGTLTLSIDVKLGANVHWLSWRDVTYRKVAPATVSGTITPAGWSTFASPYALDLSTLTATSGATAYYASEATGSTVTLSTTDATVPAGEGIMIKGTAGETFTINVAASGEAIDGNLLKGQTTTGNVAASTDDVKHYVFGYVTETPTTFGFYNLASATSVEAGKAYLEITTGSTPARALRIVFDDITAVDNVEAASEDKAQDGKFIENGKLVIVKNGVKYNAAGAKLY